MEILSASAPSEARQTRTTHGPSAGAEHLAGATRKVIEEVVGLEGSDGWSLQSTRRRLSESLACALSEREFAAIVAEVAALAWVEGGTGAVRLPEPLRPIQGLLERPGTAGLEAALAALRGVAARVRGNGDNGENLYEDFLEHLDPDRRARHSVYLTPAPLVRMLVRSVDELLVDQLGLTAGLASPDVGLLDPAAGTGAFLLEALRTRRGEPTRPGALWQGFEVQPGAYVAATLRLGRRCGSVVQLSPSPHPVRLHLQDLLAADSPVVRPGGSPWGEPAHSTLVVLGNPPWSETSPSAPWVDRLLRDGYTRPEGSRDDGYYRCGGRRVPSRNTKWLQSRYVKFLRVAQWCVDRVGRGVVALVLSDGLIDNLTMSGVRESLLGSFVALYVLDLGGNARKADSRGPDEIVDQNLFDVQQGACALILVRGGAEQGVRTFTLRGRRREKLTWLDTHTVRTIPWSQIEPVGPNRSFLIRRSPCLRSDYGSAPSMREIFERGTVGVITGRDRLVVGFEARELAARIGLLRQGRDPGVFALAPTEGFDPDEAIAKLAEDEDWERHLVPYLMRPGDHRVLFAAPYLVSRLRSAVMDEIARPGNLALVLPRRRRVFPSAWVTECAASHRVASAYEGSYAFPLYLGAERRPNLAPAVLEELADQYGTAPTPEDVFGYVYSRLWSRAFHDQYPDELRQDWPHVPFPGSFERFTAHARLGWKLAQIHLGWERTGSRPWLHGELPVRLPAQGSSFEHDGGDRLHLGLGEGYLAPVGRDVTAFQVGGHPAVAGWIRRRAGRRLGAQDIEELSRLIGAFEATRRIERELARLEGEQND
jgi:hypothetical protein